MMIKHIKALLTTTISILIIIFIMYIYYWWKSAFDGLLNIFKIPSFNNTITTLTFYKNYGKKILFEKSNNISIFPKNTTYYIDMKKFLSVLRTVYSYT